MNNGRFSIAVLTLAVILLGLANLWPRHYHITKKDYKGNQYDISGIKRGLPFAYLDRSKGQTSFWYQAVFGDLTAAGVVLIGVNILSEQKRTAK